MTSAAPPTAPRSPYRVLMYSHDSLGLGQLRRCHAIAHALVARHQDLNVLILTGLPIIGRFRFRARVDFVRLPGIVRLRNGDCMSLGLDIDVEDTVALRASIIEHTAQVFRPDLFLVDETPLGLLGEARRTLRLLRRRGCRLVLGLHDVLDGRALLAEKDERGRRVPGLERLYDDVWNYGPPAAHPSGHLAGSDGPVPPRRRFTGYLGREPQPDVPLPSEVTALAARGPFLLVAPGGARDGADLVHAVLSAYERHDAQLPWPALVVYGPFLSARHRTAFEQRVGRLDRVTTLLFHEHLENVIAEAGGVVFGGGYNTLCEVLSLGKPSLIVPRETSRGGQIQRAEAARRLRLAAVLPADQLAPETLVAALRQLAAAPPPATARLPGLLDGLSRISDLVGQWRASGPPAGERELSSPGLPSPGATSAETRPAPSARG